MKNLSVLSVTFAEEIRPEELECFRGALVDKIGVGFERYHNHNNAADAASPYHYRYPLIQYQLHYHRPRLLFLDEAVSDARHFFVQPDWDLHLAGRDYHTSIAELKAYKYEAGSDPGRFHYYRLRRWQALNTDNFQHYQTLIPLRDKLVFLEKVLSGQLLSFFSGIGYHLPEKFQMAITHFDRMRVAPYKGVKVCLFDIIFRADLVLPPGIGLGKGVSMGYGRIQKVSGEEWMQNLEYSKLGTDE